jgi:hypothetical protein
LTAFGADAIVTTTDGGCVLYEDSAIYPGLRERQKREKRAEAISFRGDLKSL